MLEQNRVGPGPFMLLQDCYLARDPALPSWVPDFGILHSSKTMYLATTGIGVSFALVSLYNASLGGADYKPPNFLDDDAVLEMEGVVVGQVENFGDVCPRFSMDWKMREAQLRAAFDQWRDLVPGEEEEYVSGGSCIEAFWRTATFDLSLIDRDYLAGNPDRRDTRLPRGALGMPPTTVEQEAEIRGAVLDAPLPKTILEKLVERRFFVTKTGYFGLGPASMEVGDIVCVLRGSFFATLVRPVTIDRYVMVGEW